MSSHPMQNGAFAGVYGHDRGDAAYADQGYEHGRKKGHENDTHLSSLSLHSELVKVCPGNLRPWHLTVKKP